MFANTRFVPVVASLLLCLTATPALALDRPARLDAAACAKPSFPAQWQAEGNEGKVTVAYLVDTDGSVLKAKVLESSGMSRLDRASIRAGSRCKFEPAAKDGQTALSWAKVTYAWIVD